MEDAFDDYLEKNWENILNSFVDSVHNGTPVAIGRSERIISEDIAKSMLASFFILLCRNPKFDAMGIYTQIKDNILYPVFDSMCKEDEESEKYDIENNEGKEYADELMTGIWYSELYKMFFKNSGGFYHNVVNLALKGCQMILFEAMKILVHLLLLITLHLSIGLLWLKKITVRGLFFLFPLNI